jgi:hypothetical protein
MPTAHGSAARTGAPFVYERRRPEATTLYEVVRDNLETLYGAVDDGDLPIALPPFVRKELDGYLDCGLLCRGFARLKCAGCGERRLVAFACKGRGFCPSCLGRRMAGTAANLVECVLPPAPLRQWVFTVPFAWRKRLGYDGKLLGAVSRILVSTVLAFYTEHTELVRGSTRSGRTRERSLMRDVRSPLSPQDRANFYALTGVGGVADESGVSRDGRGRGRGRGRGGRDRVRGRPRSTRSSGGRHARGRAVWLRPRLPYRRRVPAEAPQVAAE